MRERAGIIDCLPPRRGEGDDDRPPGPADFSALSAWVFAAIAVLAAAAVVTLALRA